MPRKKITIEEALSVLRDHGVKVKIEEANTPTPVVEVQPKMVEEKQGGKIGSTIQTITLRAAHQINGSVYGPGKCIVENKLAAALLYADQQARLADEDFLCKEERSYLVVRRVVNGVVANIGIRAPNDLFDGGFDVGRLGLQHML